MPKATKTNASVWTKVFRAIVAQIEQDAECNRVFGAANIRSWKGVTGDKAPFAPAANAPVLRLTPQPRNVDWYSPDSQWGTLYVMVELAVPSLCIDDVADLWDLLVAAVAPSNDTFCQALIPLGAETGERSGGMIASSTPLPCIPPSPHQGGRSGRPSGTVSRASP